MKMTAAKRIVKTDVMQLELTRDQVMDLADGLQVNKNQTCRSVVELCTEFLTRPIEETEIEVIPAPPPVVEEPSPVVEEPPPVVVEEPPVVVEQPPVVVEQPDVVVGP